MDYTEHHLHDFFTETSDSMSTILTDVQTLTFHQIHKELIHVKCEFIGVLFPTVDLG